MSRNTGKEYENFIEYYYKELSKLTRSEVVIDRQVSLFGIGGNFIADVIYTYSFMDKIHRVIIECKDFDRPVDMEKIRGSVAAIHSIPNCTGIIYSTSGFTANAKTHAEIFGVECVKLGELEGMFKLIGKRLEIIVMSDEKRIGEPFWGIASRENGMLEQFVYNGIKGFHLFNTKSDAEIIARLYSEKQTMNFFANGIRQEQLSLLIRLAKSWTLQFFYVIGIQNFSEAVLNPISARIGAINISPEEIEEKYLILGHV